MYLVYLLATLDVFEQVLEARNILLRWCEGEGMAGVEGGCERQRVPCHV
jgi:hypothetical protein